MISEVRVALGGVAPKPWRLPQVEAALHGQPSTADALRGGGGAGRAGRAATKANAFKVKLMQRTVSARPAAGVGIGSGRMITGQPIDRRDGREKVTGAAHYAAEFAVPDLVHAVLVQSTIAAGSIDRVRHRQRRRACPACSRSSRRTTPEAGHQGEAQQAITQPLLQDETVVYNGQHVAMVVADTLERPRPPPPRCVALTARARRRPPWQGRSTGLRAEELPQRAAPARQQPR